MPVGGAVAEEKIRLASLVLELSFLFVLSVVSNATPFFGASYTLIATADLVAYGFNAESFALVVFVTALGATVGKLFIYAGAFGLRRRLKGNKNIKLLGRWLGKAGFYLALFVTAFIPILPLDDYVYLGAGANEARLPPMLGVTFMAKLCKSTAEILLEFSGITGVSGLVYRYFGLSRLDLSIIFSAFFVVLGVAIYKLDWQKMIDSFRGRGATHTPAAAPVSAPSIQAMRA